MTTPSPIGWKNNSWSAGMALAALALLPIAAALRPGNVDAIVYPYTFVISALCVVVCVQVLRYRRRLPRVSLRLLAAYFAVHAAVYALASATAWGWELFSGAPWVISVFSTIALLLSMFAISGIPNAGGSAMDICDGLLITILCGLEVMAVSSPRGFTDYHLQVSFVMKVMVMIASVASLRGSVTNYRATVARMMTLYLAVDVVTAFLVNIVGWVWMVNRHPLLMNFFMGKAELCFCALAVATLQTRGREPAMERPSPLSQSLVPLIFLLMAVGLAPVAFRGRVAPTAAALALAIGCYVVRTHLLYRAALLEQTSLRTSASRFQQLATRDSLTGLGNRRWLEEMTAPWLTQSGGASILLIDADHFKRINDLHGHRMGDEILCLIARCMEESTDACESYCARLGGDEFVIFLPGMSKDAALSVAQDVRASVAEDTVGAALAASVSVGMAHAVTPGTLIDFLSKADKALYTCKAGGGNGVSVYREASGSLADVAVGDPLPTW